MPEFAWKAPLLFTLVHLYVWIPVPTADAFALRLERQAQSSLLLRNSASGVFVPKQELLCLKNNTGVPCVNPNDPQQCTKGASKFPAITFAFDMNVPWKFNQEWCDKVRYFADAMKADLVLLLPAQAAFEKRTEIPRSILKVIRKYFRIVRVPWVVPPKLSQGVPRRGRRGSLMHPRLQTTRPKCPSWLASSQCFSTTRSVADSLPGPCGGVRPRYMWMQSPLSEKTCSCDMKMAISQSTRCRHAHPHIHFPSICDIFHEWPYGLVAVAVNSLAAPSPLVLEALTQPAEPDAPSAVPLDIPPDEFQEVTRMMQVVLDNCTNLA